MDVSYERRKEGLIGTNMFAGVSMIFWLLYSDVCDEKPEVRKIGHSKERNEG